MATVPWEIDDTVPATKKVPWETDDTQSFSQKHPLLQKTLDYFNPIKQAQGIGETALQMGSGVLGKTLGEVGGMAAGVTDAMGLPRGRLGDGTSEDVKARIEQSTQYEPRSDAGKAAVSRVQTILHPVGKVMDAVLINDAKKAGVDPASFEGTTSNALREAENQGLGFVGVKGTGTTLEKSAAATIQKEAANVLRSRQTASQLDAGTRAVENGFKIAPGEMRPPTAMEKIAGPTDTAQTISEANQTTANQMGIRKVLRDDTSHELNQAAFDKAERAATEPFRRIEQLGTIPVYPGFKARVQNLGKEMGDFTEAEFEMIRKAPQAQKQIDSLKSAALGATDLNESIKTMSALRKQSSDVLYGGGNASAVDKAIAHAQRDLAKAIEGNIEEHLQLLHEMGPTEGFDKLLRQFQDGRQWYAQIQDLKGATNRETKNVNLHNLGNAKAAGEKMTGPLGDMGEFGAHFKMSSVPVDAIRGKIPSSYHSDVAAGVRGVAGATTGPLGYLAASTAWPIVGNMAKNVVTKDSYISRNMPKDYRPLNEQRSAIEALRRRNP